MSIYTHVASDRTPYTYLIGWSKLNKWYYGRRTKVNCHPDDFWKKYFTSSKYVKNFRKEHGEPDVIQIRKIFNNINDCVLWEEKFLNKINAKCNDNWLNKSNGYLNFDVTGKSSYYNEFGDIIQAKTDDENILNGKYTHIRKNTVIVRDSSGKTFVTSSNDPKWLSGEYIHANKGIRRIHSIGYFTAKDTDGNFYSVTKSDERIISGELVHVLVGVKNPSVKNVNMVLVYDKYVEKVIMINKDDIRYKSGELISINKGKFAVRDKDGKTFQITKYDPRWISGELVSTGKGSKAQVGMIHPTKTCPHCNKTGGARNMKRYHFDNCKFLINKIPIVFVF